MISAYSLLADGAQVTGGKLFILGGLIDRIPINVPFALVLLINVPWEDHLKPHQLSVDLVTADGGPVSIPTPVGMQAVVLKSEFAVGRPPDVIHGSSATVPLAFNLVGLPLAPGRYEFATAVDGKVISQAARPFQVVPAVAGPQV